MTPTSPAATPADATGGPAAPAARSRAVVPAQRRPAAAPPVVEPDAWTARGACRTSDPDELFVRGAAQNAAKAVCLRCPVRTECLADALDNRVEFGVWGGMTERERRALLRRRPEVASWRRLLEEARRAHEAGARGAPPRGD